MSEVTADVPVSPVGDSSGRSRPKGPILAVVAIAIAIAGVGIAGRLGSNGPTGPPGATSSPSSSATASATASDADEGPPAAAPETLPEIASRPLTGAPVLALWRRDGDDASILTWDPANPRARIGEQLRLHGLLRGVGAEATVLVSRSPSGRFTAMSALTTSPGADDRETLRIARSDGTIAWHEEVHARTLVAAAWNPTRDELVVPTPGRWLSVSFVSTKAVAGPVVRSIAVPTYEREPVGTGGPNPLVPAIVAFSDDGDTAFAAAVDSPFLLGLRPLFAIDLAHGRTRPITRLAANLADETAQAGGPDLTRVDPLTGRVVGLAPNGGSSVRIYGPDGVREVVRIDRTQILGATWGPGGVLALLSTEPGRGAEATQLELVGRDGNPIRTAITTTSVPSGGLIAGPDGYVLLVFGLGEDVELVAVRLKDGGTATTVVRSADLSGVELMGWLPAGAGSGG